MAFRNEAFSFFTHLGGALASLVGLVVLVGRADGTLAKAAFAVYGATLVLMFSSSTLHHVSHRDDGLLRRIDQAVIFIFIAGTYTPVCLLALPQPAGALALLVVWPLALGGMFLRLFRPGTHRWITIGLYLVLGWMALAGAYYVVTALSWAALGLLVAGGVVYSVGAVVYAMKRPDPWPTIVGYHGLWHVFVLVAAGLHFALIYQYVPYR